MANISKKISLNVVQQMQAGDTVRDNELKGFGVRKRGGAPSYFLQTRIKGRLRWITIGIHGSPWTPNSARKEALKLLNEIASGIDPTIEREKIRNMPTVAEATKIFMEDHSPKIAEITVRDYKRLLKDYINPVLGKYRVDELDKVIVSKAHVKWGYRPRTANHALAVLSKFISWAEERGLRQDKTNPCRGIKKYKENKRERYLSTEEFQRLGKVLNKAEANGSEDIYIIAAIRLLMFTGARVSEITKLKWEEVDLERGIIFLKQSKTGQKPIFLNEPAKEVMASIPKLSENPYVIIGNKVGSHLVNLQKPWRRIRSRAELNDVRMHDLRHSFASLAAGSGASLPLIGGLLGHSQPQTTARYAHLANNPLKEVNEQVGARLKEILNIRHD
ncbi:MAG: tyrosine-type recombinase/integrase [Methyloligellaceae bacterium]